MTTSSERAAEAMDPCLDVRRDEMCHAWHGARGYSADTRQRIVAQLDAHAAQETATLRAEAERLTAVCDAKDRRIQRAEDAYSSLRAGRVPASPPPSAAARAEAAYSAACVAYCEWYRGQSARQYNDTLWAAVCTAKSALDAAPAEAGLGHEEAGLVIVFDGPPSHEAGRFVECEDGHGRSINAGEWHKRDDGLWELRIRAGLLRRPGGEV